MQSLPATITYFHLHAHFSFWDAFCFALIFCSFIYFPFQLIGNLVKTKNICSYWEKNYVTYHVLCSSCGTETTLYALFLMF